MFNKSLLIILVTVISAFSFVESSYAEEREFVIIDKAAPATIREAPNGRSSLGKIPAGTKIEINGKKEIRSGMLVVTWYKVSHNGKNGWISQYVTMGDIIKEDDAGVKSSVRAKGADEVRYGGFNKQAKENFKSWALRNTAVTYLEYPENSDWQIWVKLKPNKYTTKNNVESIALQLARAYKMQTGFNKLVIVSVWYPHKAKIFVKGRL